MKMKKKEGLKTKAKRKIQKKKGRNVLSFEDIR